MIDPEPEEGFELEMEADDMYTLCKFLNNKVLISHNRLLCR